MAIILFVLEDTNMKPISCLNAIAKGCSGSIDICFHNNIVLWLPITIIIALALIVFAITFFGTFKMIFDDYGITSKLKLKFLFFSAYKWYRFASWDDINSIHYESEPLGFVISFLPIEGKNRDSFGLNFTLINRKEALEYAIEKIPVGKISEEAQKKLRKMNITFMDVDTENAIR